MGQSDAVSWKLVKHQLFTFYLFFYVIVKAEQMCIVEKMEFGTETVLTVTILTSECVQPIKIGLVHVFSSTNMREISTMISAFHPHFQNLAQPNLIRCYSNRRKVSVAINDSTYGLSGWFFRTLVSFSKYCSTWVKLLARRRRPRWSSDGSAVMFDREQWEWAPATLPWLTLTDTDTDWNLELHWNALHWKWLQGTARLDWRSATGTGTDGDGAGADRASTTAVREGEWVRPDH